MTRGRPEALRIALVDPGDGSAPYALDLAVALRDAGHHPEVLTSRPSRVAEAVLRGRGFAGRLTQAPRGLAALTRGDFDVAHAFSPPDVVSALAWRRMTGRPVAFTCVQPLGRERLADRRLRLWLVRRAVEGADALVAGTEESRAALLRWLAIEAPVIEPNDAAGHTRLYRDLLTRRA